MSKKKTKPKVHVTYNQKRFLVPNSIRSMAVIFTKIHKDGTAIIRISDCNRTIKLWNNLNEPEEVHEMMTKIETLQIELEKFKQEVKIKLPFQGKI